MITDVFRLTRLIRKSGTVLSERRLFMVPDCYVLLFGAKGITTQALYI